MTAAADREELRAEATRVAAAWLRAVKDGDVVTAAVAQGVLKGMLEGLPDEG